MRGFLPLTFPVLLACTGGSLEVVMATSNRRISCRVRPSPVMSCHTISPQVISFRPSSQRLTAELTGMRHQRTLWGTIQPSHRRLLSRTKALKKRRPLKPPIRSTPSAARTPTASATLCLRQRCVCHHALTSAPPLLRARAP